MSEQAGQKSELKQQLIAAAAEAFVRLPVSEQQVLTLAVDARLQVPAIAEQMSLSDGDIRQLMRTSLQTLFEAVNEAAKSTDLATKDQSA